MLELLGTLESGSFAVAASAAGIQESVLAAMTAAHAALAAAVPPPAAPRVDAPLEPDSAVRGSWADLSERAPESEDGDAALGPGAGGAGQGDKDMSEEELMDELEKAEDDVGALAVARRLQRSRRLGVLGGVCKDRSRRK